MNPIALKKNHNTRIKEKWASSWKKAPRGIKMSTWDSTTPSNNFLNTISFNKFSRNDSSLLTQLYTGHVPLNSYLHRFKLVDSPRCPACGAASETTNHFLFTCPVYAYERWPLKNNCKGELTLHKLLSDRKLTTSLLTYIKSTERFKNKSEFIRPEP
jgi:hypothetical protein